METALVVAGIGARLRSQDVWAVCAWVHAQPFGTHVASKQTAGVPGACLEPHARVEGRVVKPYSPNSQARAWSHTGSGLPRTRRCSVAVLSDMNARVLHMRHGVLGYVKTYEAQTHKGGRPHRAGLQGALPDVCSPLTC